MTKRNERTTARVAKIAAKYLAWKTRKSKIFDGYVLLPNGDVINASLWRDILAMSGSLLTQTAPKPKRKPARRKPSK